MKILILFALIFVGTVAVSAQSECPADKVCISREAAVKAIADAKTVDAQKAEIISLLKAVDDLKQQVNDVKLSAATAMAENSILKQDRVSDAAMIQLLLQQTKKKRNAFITFF